MFDFELRRMYLGEGLCPFCRYSYKEKGVLQQWL